MRRVDFKFELPPVWGIYVYKGDRGQIYIFGSGDSEEEIESTIVHETLHFVLHKVVGYLASSAYDNVYEKVEKD